MMDTPEVPIRAVVEPPEIPGILIGETDALFLRSWSSIAVGLSLRGKVRYRGESRTVHLDHDTLSTRLEDSDVRSLNEYAGGVLESLVVVKTTGEAAIDRGRTWVNFGIQDESGQFDEELILALLGADYYYDGHPPAWPPVVLESPLDGRGFIRNITGTDPAAGAEASETVPTGATWKLRSWLDVFTTDVTVANRFPQVVLDDGTTIFWRSRVHAAQAASTSNVEYQKALGDSHLDAASNISQFHSLLPASQLLAGYRIRTTTTAIVAGDDYASPEFQVEEWIVPA